MLSDPRVIALLRRDYVNAWILAKDLDGLAAETAAPDMPQLCGLLRENYGYPVDSVLLSAELQVLGHVNVHEDAGSDAKAYLAFLREGLKRAGRDVGVEEPATTSSPEANAPDEPPASRARAIPAMKLTPESPQASVLDVFQSRGLGQPSLTFYPIDARAFAGGGELEIEVRVGSANGAGKFELCAPVAADPGWTGGGDSYSVQPVRVLGSVTREASGKLTYAFEKGALFGLAVMPAPGFPQGEVNAFFATVTCRPR